jgi:hypothetical protein
MQKSVKGHKKELASKASSLKRAGDGTRTRDSLLGKQERKQTSFPGAFISYLLIESTCSPMPGVMRGE